MLTLFPLLSVLLAPPNGLELARHGFTDVNFISFHGLDDHILVIGTLDHRIALFDEGGQAIAVHAPGERVPTWNNPLFMGASEDRIFMATGGREVFCFDHALQTVPCDYPTLPIGAVYGLREADDRFLLFGYGMEKHALTRVSLVEDAWQVDASMVPVPMRPSEQEGFPDMPEVMMRFHDGMLFRWQPLGPGADHYTVDILGAHGSGPYEQVMGVQHGLDELPDREMRHIVLTGANKHGSGYAVMVALLDKETFAYTARILDLFSASGEHLARRTVPPSQDLRPLGGTDRALLLDLETSVLTPLR